MREDLPSGTVTFLFTDVEGSTRLLEELGPDGYARALADHRRIVRQACASFGGSEVDSEGDAFFLAFARAPDALEAAAAIIERLGDDLSVCGWACTQALRSSLPRGMSALMCIVRLGSLLLVMVGRCS